MKLFSVFKSTLVEPLEYFDFIDRAIKKLSCDTTVKNNLYYLKLNLIRTAKIVRSKSKIENWCTYAPIISVLSQPGKYVRKIITTMYIHQKMIHASHKKIQ